MGLADLHIHSIHSHDGTCAVSAILKYTADYTNLNVIAITDHDSIAGCQEAVELGPRYGIDVIPGCEVSTADGHLLTLFIDRPIRPGRSLIDTLREVGDMGGIAVAAHPMARATPSLRFETIWRAVLHPQVSHILVGVEAYNGGLVITRQNPKIAALCSTLPLAQLGNSDSHVLRTIGAGCSEFPGTTAAELKTALIAQTTRVRSGRTISGVGVLRSYLPQIFMRKLGWATWNADPEAPLTYARLSRVLAPVENR